jgi:putative transposase
MVKEERSIVYGFVVMPNHIHIIWENINDNSYSGNQRDFMKFISQQLKFKLISYNTLLLEKFLVNKADRKYQIWNRNPLSIELYSEKVIVQKLDYIHNNPLQEKWQLANIPEEYYYSSASFYEGNGSPWKFLTNIFDV